MCGIVGFTHFKDSKLLHNMIQSMVHRGPDDEGTYESDDISFGFRRLSIVDLAAGNQPLFNEDQSICVVFNGEIYNFKDIKTELLKKGHLFKTNTDGEIIAHIYEEEGIQGIQKFHGMFAFALWDKNLKKLFLVRDRLGIKPLHYALSGNKLLFASEVKSLLQYPNLSTEINYEAMDAYLSFRYVPGEDFLLKNIKVLPPGHYLLYDQKKMSIHRYWQMNMEEKALHLTEADTIQAFRNLLEEAVKYRLMSDVPLGVYLSGGLDSSVIAALVKKFHPNLITFSHGFDNQHDELKYARCVAKYLQSDHREVMIQEEHLNFLPDIVYHMDSPIANSDIVGFYLLAKLATNNVKVVLAGEGADELFGSYVHQEALFYGSKLKERLPSFLWKRILPEVIKRTPLSWTNALFSYPGYSLDQKSKEKILNYFNSDNLSQDYFVLNSLFSNSDKEELYQKNLKSEFSRHSFIRQGMEHILEDKSIKHILNRLIKLECEYWLPAYHLIKEDKIAMSQGLEQRYPFLDHRLVEFMALVPPNLKLRRKTRKYLLRKASEDILPPEIVYRPKGPILVPIDKCFGKTFDILLSDWLSEARVKKRGFFNYSFIKNLRDGRNKNPFLYDRQLFSLLVLEIWCHIFLDRRGQR